MPELPEVETVRRTLAPAIGAVVTGVWASGMPLHGGRRVEERALAQVVTGAEVEGVRRLGKYLLIDFVGRDGVLVIHLGMSGRLRLEPRGAPLDAHVHARLMLRHPAAGHAEIRFRDPRRFGLLTLARRGLEREHPSLAGLGFDPLTGGGDGSGGEDALAAVLGDGVRGRRAPLKAALLDQRIVAGIGNIYASEALWEARLHPELPAEALSRARSRRLARAIFVVIDRALDNGGTSLRDFVAADGASGENADYLWVYGRAREPCPRPRCTGRIARRLIQGRATFFCPRCQRRPR